jgi:hypothetical protein
VVRLLFATFGDFKPFESLIDLMMEAAGSSETWVDFYRTIRRNNPEDSHLDSTSFKDVMENTAVTGTCINLRFYLPDDGGCKVF